MRILYFIDDIGPAGAEQSLLVLAGPMRELGIDLHVAYSFDRVGAHDRFRAAGVTLHSIAGPGGRVARARRARVLVRDVAPDLVHTTLFESDIAGRVGAAAAGVPVVSSLVNAMYGPEQLANPTLRPSRVRMAKMLDIATARVVVRFHAISRDVATTMARRLHIRRSRIDVIYRGRDQGELGRRDGARRERARAGLELPDGTFLVLGVARHEYQKGLDTLVDAFLAMRARRPEVQLLIAGREGTSTPQLERALAGAGVEPASVLLGARDDVAELLCAADVLAFPTRWEGLGSTLIEAMALEVPLVVSDLPVTREVVGDANASFVRVDDADALRSALEGVLDDRAGAERRAAAAYQRFLDNFTAAEIAAQMVSFYERALSGSRRRWRFRRRAAAGAQPGADH